MIRDDQVDVYYSGASPISCRVFVRVRGLAAADGWSLAGQVRGPECRSSRMLPATHRLQPASSTGENVLAVVDAPDPCFWSPQLPAFYRLAIDVLHHGSIEASFQRTLGIRPLAVRGASLYWESRRWVLRAVCRESTFESDLSCWRECDAAMLATNPDETLCRQATEEGLLIAARIDVAETELLDEARRLTKWGAVAFALVDGECEITHDLLASAPNLFIVNQAPGAPLSATNIMGDLPVPSNSSRPALALRRLSNSTDIESARAACDRLQRDLAPGGDWAGYVV